RPAQAAPQVAETPPGLLEPVKDVRNHTKPPCTWSEGVQPSHGSEGTLRMERSWRSVDEDLHPGVVVFDLNDLPLGPLLHRPDDGVQVEDVLIRSEEHTSELQSRENLVCRLLLEKKK